MPLFIRAALSPPEDSSCIFLIVRAHSVFRPSASRVSSPNSTDDADFSLFSESRRFWYALVSVSLLLRSMSATWTAATSSTPPSFSMDFMRLLRAFENSPLLMSSLLSS